MDQETRTIFFNMQQAILSLKKAEALLDDIDGMGDYVDHIDRAIEDLEQELAELLSLVGV